VSPKHTKTWNEANCAVALSSSRAEQIYD